MGTFTIYLDDKQTVSESLMGLLGFIDYASGQWLRDENNSAIVDEIVQALTDIDYKWVVTYSTLDDRGRETVLMRFENLDEWCKWFEE